MVSSFPVHVAGALNNMLLFRFDIYSFGFDTSEDEAGMLKTSASLNALISDEVNGGIPANRVILGGFSQGGAMSLLAGLTNERKLGGVAVMSGWLPLKNKFKAVCSLPPSVFP